MKRPLDTEVAWLAGFLDGEGSVGIFLLKRDHVTRPYFLRPAVQMSTTDPPSLFRCLSILKKLGIRGAGYVGTEKDPVKHKDAWRLFVYRIQDINVLSAAMIPYSITKRKQWQIINEYTFRRLQIPRGDHRYTTFTARELTLARQIHLLNLRGSKNPKAVARSAQWLRKLKQIKKGYLSVGRATNGYRPMGSRKEKAS